MNSVVSLKPIPSNRIKKSIRATKYLQRIFVRNAIISIGPTTLNDVVVHHAHVDVHEMTRVVTDTVTVDGMSALVLALVKLVTHS